MAVGVQGAWGYFLSFVYNSYPDVSTLLANSHPQNIESNGSNRDNDLPLHFDCIMFGVHRQALAKNIDGANIH